MPEINGASIFILIFILGSCLVFLLFNYMCYRLLKANKENNIAPGWINNFRKLFLVLSIIALIAIAFMFIAATTAFITDYNGFPKKQRPFFFIFLLLMIALVSSGIENIVYYFKALKQNKSIVNSVINTIGENTAQ